MADADFRYLMFEEDWAHAGLLSTLGRPMRDLAAASRWRNRAVGAGVACVRLIMAEAFERLARTGSISTC